MKKTLFLSMLALAALASQVRAEHCAREGSSLYCKWGNDCNSVNNDYTPNIGVACATIITNCEQNGYLYTDETCETWAGTGNDPSFTVKYCQWPGGCEAVRNQAELDNCKTNGFLYNDNACTEWANEGRDPNDTPLGCCNWDTETVCRTIMQGDDDATTKVKNCSGGSNRFWADIKCPNEGGACPTTSPTYPVASSSSTGGSGGSSSSTGGGGGSSSSTGGSGGSSSSTGGGGLSSSTGGNTGGSSSSTGGSGGYNCKITATYCTQTQTIAQCSSYGGTVVDDCSDNVPIINLSPIAGTAGLKVVAHNSNLHIYSAKETTVQLYDMRGELVSNWKIQAGENILNLKNQKKGIYYAVVSSGSHKQSVKVAVM
jgi:hypothetical protein